MPAIKKENQQKISKNKYRFFRDKQKNFGKESSKINAKNKNQKKKKKSR